MSELISEVKLLRGIDFGYVDRVRKNYGDKVVDDYIHRGLIEETSMEWNVSRLRVQSLRKALRDKGLPASGDKTYLVGMVLENLSIEEIMSLPLEPRFMLTDAGKEYLLEAEEKLRNSRLERAEKVADLILLGEYKKAADLIRPAGAISSSSDYLPEGIGRCLADISPGNRGLAIAAVEDVIMGYRPQTVLSDLSAVGYDISEDLLQRVMLLSHEKAQDAFQEKTAKFSTKFSTSDDGIKK